VTATARRNEYLEALGIDVWVPVHHVAGARSSSGDEDQAPEPVSTQSLSHSIVIGPGTGSLMLLCANSEEASTPLAADIARCLDCEPVWSWLSPAGSDNGVPLEQAVADRLFTRILGFGTALEGAGIDPSAPALGSARLLRTASLPELARLAAARKALWAELSANQWCGPRGG
jgi:hypothetical protein